MNAPCVDKWSGVTCICLLKSYQIVALILSSHCMQGSIPNTISNLGSLTKLALSQNNLISTIPSTIGKLSALSYLTMSRTSLTGTIPASFSSLTLLKIVDITNTYLSGPLAINFENMLSLELMFLDTNYLDGNFPPSLCQAPSLEFLSMEYNHLSGNLSVVPLSSMKKLLYLSLNNNTFTGRIPSLSSNESVMTNLFLANNLFSGPIPADLGNLSRLQYFYVDTNLLTSTIPVEITYPRNISIIRISSNELTGTIPACIFLTGIANFLATNNYLTGTIPSTVGQASKLTDLELNYNLLNGSIPDSIGNLTDLVVLELASNFFTSSIPLSLGHISTLENLILYNNSLTGTISPALFDSSTIVTVYLFDNHLEGTIPTNVGNAVSLYDLLAYNNHLTSTIPAAMFQLPHMTFLVISDNLLSGSIPMCTSHTSQKGFVEIIANDNFITGSISSNISFYPQLAVFSLTNNLLTSSLPDSFGHLTALGVLALSNNYFTGSLPITSLQFLNEIVVGENEFSGKIFDQLTSNHLKVVNIANNLFTGTIPEAFFTLNPLQIFLAGSNCIDGTIPNSICDSHLNLTILDMTSTGGNPQCRRNLQANQHLPFFIRGTFSSLGLQGTIPACLFSSSTMQVMHLSGNFLQGHLSDLNNTSSALYDLAVSNNRLSGSIPASIQRHAFQALDLSSNRFDGSLVDDFFVADDQSSLKLAVNRLSGNLPSSIVSADKNSKTNLSTMNVLASNIFECDSNDLPAQDPYSKVYSCGSDQLNLVSYLWLGIFGGFMILISLISYGCYEHDLIRQIRIWIDSMLAASVNNCSNHLPAAMIQTKIFIDIMNYFIVLSLIILTIFLLIVIPTNILLHPEESIVADDYGYIVSMVFLHGIIITTISGMLVVSMLSLLVISINLMHREIVSMTKYHERAMVVESSRFFLVKYSIATLIFLVNMVVTFTANAAYVNASLNADYTRSQLLLIQYGLAVFKLTWNSCYIPLSIHVLSRYTSVSKTTRLTLIMSLVNFVFAPILASFALNQSCFNAVFVSSDEITTDVSITTCIQELIQSKTVICASYITATLSSSSYPAFQYSYACGTAVLVSYVPVLIFSYLMNGLILPCVRLLLINFEGQVFGCLSRIKELDSYISSAKDIFRRVRGRNVTVNYMLHVTVLLTFGLACPLLGITVAVAIIINSYLNRLIIARSIVLSTSLPSGIKEEVSSVGISSSNPIIMNEIELGGMNPSSSSLIAAVDAEIETQARPPRADVGSDMEEGHPEEVQAAEASKLLSPDLQVMEYLDMRLAWQGFTPCAPIMVFAVYLFWSFLFFDMIADGYGYVNGLIFISIFAVVGPAFSFLIGLIVSRGYHRCLKVDKNQEPAISNTVPTSGAGDEVIALAP
jgi:hypothetical protein